MYSQIRALKSDVHRIATAGRDRPRRRGRVTKDEQISTLKKALQDLREQEEKLPKIKKIDDIDPIMVLREQLKDKIEDVENQIKKLEEKDNQTPKTRRQMEVTFEPAKFFSLVPRPLHIQTRDNLVEFMKLQDLNPLATSSKMKEEIAEFLGIIESPHFLRQTLVTMNIYNETMWVNPDFQKLDTTINQDYDAFQQLCVFQKEILQKTTSDIFKKEYIDQDKDESVAKRSDESKRVLDKFYFIADMNVLEESDSMPYAVDDKKTKADDLRHWLSHIAGYDEEVVEKAHIQFLRAQVKTWLVSNASKYYQDDEKDDDEGQDEKLTMSEIRYRYDNGIGGVNYTRHLVMAFKFNTERISEAENDIEKYNQQYPDSPIATVAEIRAKGDDEERPDLLLGEIAAETDAAMVRALMTDIEKHGADIDVTFDGIIWDTENIEDERESQLKVLHGRIDRYNKDHPDTQIPERETVQIESVVDLTVPDDMDLFQQYNLLTKRMESQDNKALENVSDEARNDAIQNATSKEEFDTFLLSLAAKHQKSKKDDGFFFGSGEEYASRALEGQERELQEYRLGRQRDQMEKNREAMDRVLAKNFAARLLTTDPDDTNYRFMVQLNKLFKKQTESTQDIYNSQYWDKIKTTFEADSIKMSPKTRETIENAIFYDDKPYKKEDLLALKRKSKRMCKKVGSKLLDKVLKP